MPRKDTGYVQRFVNGVEIKREPGIFMKIGNGYKCTCGKLFSGFQSKYAHDKSYVHLIAIGQLPIGYSVSKTVGKN